MDLSDTINDTAQNPAGGDSTGRSPLSAEQLAVVDLMVNQNMSYVEASTRTGWSRGRIYALLKQLGLRKTEARILERHRERQERQLAHLREIIGTTEKADVLDFLDGLPDDSIDLHITSIPYNVGKKYGGADSADRMRTLYYHGWVMQIVSEMARTLKPGGTLCLQVGNTKDDEEELLPLDVLLFDDLRRAGLKFRSRIIWVMSHGLTPEGRLAERYETILVFSKGKQRTFNPTPLRAPQKQPGKRAFKGPNKGKLSCHPLGAFPTNVWHIANIKNDHPETKWGRHEAPFPKEVPKRLALLYSRPGDLVCDPFSGSGATHHASVESGRAFVGADLFYEDLRERRLKDAHPDTFCPLPGVTDESVAIWQMEARRTDSPAVPITPAQEQKIIQETLDLFAS